MLSPHRPHPLSAGLVLFFTRLSRPQNSFCSESRLDPPTRRSRRFVRSGVSVVDWKLLWREVLGVETFAFLEPNLNCSGGSGHKNIIVQLKTNETRSERTWVRGPKKLGNFFFQRGPLLKTNASIWYETVPPFFYLYLEIVSNSSQVAGKVYSPERSKDSFPCCKK